MRRLEDRRLPHEQGDENREATRAGGARGGWRRLPGRALSEVPAAVDAVLAEVVVLGYSSRDVLAVRIGLEEALVNAVKHGNREDPGKCVRIGYQVTAEELVAEVVDGGPGFCPDLLPDP